MDMLLRAATKDDVETVFAIRTSVSENHLSRAQLDELGITAEALAGALRADECLWIVELDGVAAGFAMIDREDACVFAAFVLPQHEGRGVGKMLLSKAEAELFRTNDTIWLETSGSSRAAQFYRGRGWVVARELASGDVRFEKRKP